MVSAENNNNELRPSQMQAVEEREVLCESVGGHCFGSGVQ